MWGEVLSWTSVQSQDPYADWSRIRIRATILRFYSLGRL
jgi:hypothetical protein